MRTEGREAPLVRAGADAIQQWLKENPGEIIAANHAIVADLDLSGANLSAANLVGGQFLRCNLSHVSFAQANLDGAEFDNCILDDADFRGANLRAAKITAKSLNGARFGASRSLGRVAQLQAVDGVLRPIVVDRSLLPWYDRWIGWDRLRFLATIRIFVPSYI